MDQSKLVEALLKAPIVFLPIIILLFADIRKLAFAHPVLTVVCILVYYILLWLARIAWRVLQKFEKIIADSIFDWLKNWFRLAFCRYRRRYYKQLEYRHRHLNFSGLRTTAEYAMDLERVFIQPSLAPASPSHASPNPLRTCMNAASFSIWNCLGQKDAATYCLAVIGPPGSGKSTIVQHIALALARNRQRRYERRALALTPILVRLRDHIKEILAPEPPTLAELVENYERKKGSRPAEGWFLKALQRRRALVMFDGLDEVGDETVRRGVVKWVENQIECFGGNRFIVTSRPHGYLGNPLRSANVLEVQAFDLDRIRHFVRQWYLADEISHTRRDDEGVRHSARDKSADLLNRLNGAPPILAMAVNPLCLTMIAMVHRYRATLPDRRIELYEEICDVLLGHWQKAKDIQDPYTAAQKRAALEPLALHMMKLNTREIVAAEAAEVIRAPLERIGGPLKDNPEAFLRHVQDNSGLLVPIEEGSYGFAHKTFEEFLAAARLLAPATRDENLLLDYLLDEWWRETILLYCAKSDATPFLRACLARFRSDGVSSLKAEALMLAWKITGERMSADAAVEREVRDLILGNLENDNDDLRRLATEVLLQIRLEEDFVQIADGVQMDTSFITCAEYQLFLDAQGGPAKLLKPLHWESSRFPPGHGTRPVLGMLPQAADLFCKWLTDFSKKRGSAQTRFRLPASSEIEPASQPASPRRLGIMNECQTEPIFGYTSDSGLVFTSGPRNRIFTWKNDYNTLKRSFIEQFRKEMLPDDKKRGWEHLIDALMMSETDDSGLISIFTLTLALTRTRALAIDRTRALAIDRTRALAIDRTRALARARSLDLPLDRACAFARALQLARNRSHSHISIAIRSFSRSRLHFRPYDLSSALNLAFTLILSDRSGKNIKDFFDLSLYFHDLSLCREQSFTNVSRFFRYFDEDTFETDAYRYWRDFCLAWFDMLILIDARRRGLLPAWEGIRLVREQIKMD